MKAQEVLTVCYESGVSISPAVCLMHPSLIMSYSSCVLVSLNSLLGLTLIFCTNGANGADILFTFSVCGYC